MKVINSSIGRGCGFFKKPRPNKKNKLIRCNHLIDSIKSKNRLCIKNLAGALAIPVLVAILLQGICMAKGKTMIMNMTSFDNFVVYIAIVMITTIALSINLNSGRFDFSLGSMALLSSVIGGKCKTTYKTPEISPSSIPNKIVSISIIGALP